MAVEFSRLQLERCNDYPVREYHTRCSEIQVWEAVGTNMTDHLLVMI